MNYRRFGRTGWQVSEIGYGMWGMGGWSGSDDAESMKSLQVAVEWGCNFFDTAFAYGEGHSEGLLGRLVKAYPRKKLYSATKIPPKNRKWPAKDEYSLDDSYPADYIEAQVHASLANTGLDAIDLFQFHTWNDQWARDDRWANKVDDLRRQGLFKAIGISINRWEPANGIEAVKSGLIDAVQVVYNIFDQNPEDELFPACEANDVAVIARVPFDEGSLTGSLTYTSTWPEGDWRHTYFTPDNLKATVDRVEALRPLIPRGDSMAEVALRFILNDERVSTIIPGMRKDKNVRENLATSDLGPLDAPLHKALQAHRWERTPAYWTTREP